MAGWLLAALFAGPQEIEDLIDDLGSDAIAVREDAAARLVEIGREALPGLRKAAKDQDSEVSGRARVLIGRIGVRENLTPRLIKALPEVDLRLINGTPATWTEVFWEAVGKVGEGKVGDEDLDILVSPAIRGARLGTEKRNLCRVAGARRLHSAVPALIGMLKDSNGDVRAGASRALGEIGAQEAVNPLAAVLRDRYLYARGDAAEALGRLRAGDTAARLVPLLGDRQAYVHQRAVGALEALGPQALPALENALKEGREGLRARAAELHRKIRADLKD